tara:strand:+ start:1771 stop:2148 length:378 start_codon:yes stop_codon:yes gene_type:complete
MTNLAFRLNLDDNEASSFFNILPLARITASKREKKAVMKMMGYTNPISFVHDIDENDAVQEQYSILLYLVMLRADYDVLENFFNRITWVNKKMEKIVRDMLWIESDSPDNETLEKWFSFEQNKDM